MAFPVNSETFACVDIKSLSDQGVEVKVFNLLAQRPNHQDLVFSRQLGNISISSASVQLWPHYFAAALRHVPTLLHLLGLILRYTFKKPAQCVKSLFLLPRTMYLFDQIGKERPDIVHLFWGHYPAMLGYAVKTHHKPTVLTQFLGAYDLTMQYPIAGLCARKADLIFTHANINKDLITPLGVAMDKVIVVHRGIDLKSFKPPTEREHPVVFSAGRLIQSKGMEHVLSVFAKVFQKRSDAILKIAGEGPELSALKTLTKTLGIEQNVHFLGHQSQAQLFQAMQQAAVFLFMSQKDSERLPNVIKEALYAGCYCISTNTPGMSELIPNEQVGLLLPAKYDENVIANKIIEQLDNPSASSEPAKAWIAEHFNADRQMQKYLSAWKKMLA